VSPGWEEGDFELARREALLGEFPGHSSIIEALTR
jgi:predicted cupin superfamily sugar epimerase